MASRRQVAEPDGLRSPETRSRSSRAPYLVEVWNDYDPSQRFAASSRSARRRARSRARSPTTSSSPGSTPASTPTTSRRSCSSPRARARSSRSARPSSSSPASSSFSRRDPTTTSTHAAPWRSGCSRSSRRRRCSSTFQQAIYPIGGNGSARSRRAPVVTELDPNNLPEDFPFSLEELGMAEARREQRELTMTERLIGMTEPGKPPESVSRVNEPTTPGARARERDRYKRSSGEAAGGRTATPREIAQSRAGERSRTSKGRSPPGPKPGASAIPPRPRRPAAIVLRVGTRRTTSDGGLRSFAGGWVAGCPRWISATNSSSSASPTARAAAPGLEAASGVRQYEARPRECAASRTM